MEERPLLPPPKGGGENRDGELARTLELVCRRHLRRVSDVAEPFEVDSFDDLAVLDVQARDDSLSQHVITQ